MNTYESNNNDKDINANYFSNNYKSNSGNRDILMNSNEREGDANNPNNNPRVAYVNSNSNCKKSKNDWESLVLLRKESIGGKKIFF